MSEQKFDPLVWAEACAETARLNGEKWKVTGFTAIAEELRRGRTLREAVAWERECEEFDKWANDNYQGSYEWDRVVYCAHAEVDRLIQNDAGPTVPADAGLTGIPSGNGRVD